MVHDGTKMYGQRLLRSASGFLGVCYDERLLSCFWLSWIRNNCTEQFLTFLGSGNDESLPTFDGISALVLICLNSSDTATWVSHVVK